MVNEDRFSWDDGDMLVLDEDAPTPEPAIVYTVVWSGSEERAKAKLARWYKHLQGQHPQRFHGRGGAAGAGDLPTTRFDNDDVRAARAENATYSSTHNIRTPERYALRETIKTNLERTNGVANPKPEDNYKVTRGREVDIILGPPAAGKSTRLADPLRRASKSMLIDSDEAKAGLPEFGGGRYANRVHEESSMISQGRGGMLSRAVERGDNITLPIVGKSEAKVKKLIETFARKGYTVRLHMVDLPIEKSAQRAVDRFMNPGPDGVRRFVDPVYVLSVDSRPMQTYQSLQSHPSVSSHSYVSTDN